MSNFHKLETCDLGAFGMIQKPNNPIELDLNSPISSIWTDFQKTAPLMLESGTSVDDAVTLMRKAHVRSKLIIDSEEQFLGLLTLAALESRKVLSMANRMGTPRQELTVKDIMTPKSELHGLTVEIVQHARIGDVLMTLQSEGDHHVLVVDAVAGTIRGIISASEIAAALKLDIDIRSKAASFAEVFDVMYHNRDILR